MTGSSQRVWTTALRGGAATAAVLGALAGAHALRRVGASVWWPANRDDLRDEDFLLLDRDPDGTVVAEDGVRLAFRSCGPENAPATAIFVHGFCNSMESFHFQRRDLERLWGPQVRLVFYDQRGHGRSGAPTPGSCTVPQIGRDLLAVIEQVAPDGPLLLIGHSMGGMAVLGAVAQAPAAVVDRVRAVALLSTAAAEVTATGVGQLLRSPALDGVRLAAHLAPALVQMGRTTTRQLLRPFLHVSSFHGEVSPTLSRFTTSMIDRVPTETMVAFSRAVELHDESAALPRLAALPGLVLAGAHDLVIPFGNSRALARDLPNADLVRVTDAAHMVHLQCPDLVNGALDRLAVRAGLVEAAKGVVARG
ncbi:alpha/beta fold hydrolase [Nocardia aurantia]|uniref:Putative aminoacrylate hydrolase RutD n=1 Tax=Nocardia aurantia TaxID=2585199 RepID=A0A7K0DVW7_9NOCA|nr:alpha/beta hydrolase [Nocardia aurantia]MQY29875.1 putative aminoacrylate hydrolase RutD [Nocardia aurantia]